MSAAPSKTGRVRMRESVGGSGGARHTPRDEGVCTAPHGDRQGIHAVEIGGAMTRLRRTMTVLALSGVVALAGCTGGSGGGSASTSPPSPSASPSPSKAPTPKVNPLTGEKPTTNPVIAVKIEDTALGRPQVGTNKADIVYVEQVEGGLTRLLAIFNSSLPNVEPVRSVRPSDPELVLQYGHIIV